MLIIEFERDERIVNNKNCTIKKYEMPFEIIIIHYNVPKKNILYYYILLLVYF